MNKHMGNIGVANENPDPNEKGPSEKDWVNSPLKFFIMWGLPILAIISTNFGLFQQPATNFILAGALFWMGSACLFNSRKCKRVHCRYTGPWLVLASLVPLLEGLGVISLSLNAWNTFATLTMLGTPLIWYFSEKIFGKYYR